MCPVRNRSEQRTCPVHETPAFVHRTTGDVLFVQAGDEAAALHFPGLPLGKLRATLAASPEWLAVPKHRSTRGASSTWVRSCGVVRGEGVHGGE